MMNQTFRRKEVTYFKIFYISNIVYTKIKF